MPASYNFRKIISESYGVLLVAAVIGLAAGYLLENHLPRHVAIFLMMVPPLNSMGGNIGSVLAARLSSALHLGVVTPDFQRQRVLGINITASGILGIISFFVIGVSFFFIEYLVFSGALLTSFKIMLIFFSAGLLLTLILIGVTVTSTFISYKKGIDPDNVVMPIVTTLGDIGGIASLIILIHLTGV